MSSSLNLYSIEPSYRFICEYQEDIRQKLPCTKQSFENIH